MSETLDQTILTTMPYFIAVQYKRMLDAPCAEDKVRGVLRVYELGIRTLALAVVSQYLIRDYDRISDYELNQLLETKLPNATLNVWQRIFFLGLRAYGGQRDLLFVSELYDLYWDRSVEPPMPRPGITDPFSRLTQIRNNLEWGFAPTDEGGWQALCDESVSLLKQVMANFVFFRNYELIRIVNQEGNRYWYESHTGLEITSVSDPLETEHELGLGWFYLSKERRDFLKLHPLLIFWEDITERSDVAVYDRHIREDNLLQYLTVTLWRKILDSTNVFDFIRMLYTTLEEYKRGREKYRQLAWWKLQEVAQAISQQQMATVSGKYRTDLYLQRDKTRTAFEDFLASDKICFVLTGTSGVGKSNLLLALADEYGKKRPGVCLLMYDGAQLDPRQSLTAIVSQGFSRHIMLGEREKIVDIWQEITLIEDIDERKVVLVIDAINENPRGKELLMRINELVVESHYWPWLKVVVTSRPEAWKAIKRGIRLAEAQYYRQPGEEKLGVEMETFSYSERLDPWTRDELPRAYEKYRTAFQLQTAYSDLPVDVRRALRDPLVMRLVADTYQKQELPTSIKATEVYEKYLDGLIRTGRLRVEDIRFLTHELMPLMIREGHYANVITAKEVDTARTSDGKPLFELIHNDGRLADGKYVNQSYGNLVDAGILIQRGTALDYEIGFRYERFYDYHAGMRLLELNATLRDKLAAYAEQIGLTQQQQYLWGAVKCTLIQELATDGRSTILTLCGEDEHAVREIMAAVLKEYGQENPVEVHRILAELMEGQTPSLLKRISEGSWHLSQDQLARELSAKRIAVNVAGTLGFSNILAQGASDSSSSLRVDAVKQIFYLWRNDRLELSATAENRGVSALKTLGHNVAGPLGIPKAAVLESVIGISVLMFLEVPDDPILGQELQAVYRQVIDGLLHANTRVGRALLRVLVGDRALSIFVNFAARVTAEDPRYYMGQIEEFAAFFELPTEKRLWLRMILPYLDPDCGRIEEVGDVMKHVFETDDLLTGGVLALALVAHGRKRPADIVPVIAELFEYVMSLSPRGVPAVQYLSGALYEVLRCQESIDEETWKLVDYFASAPLDKTRAVLVSRIGREYFCIGFLYPSLLYLEKLGHPGLHLWRRYLGLAVEEENWEFLGDLLHLAGELALPYHVPSAALAILRELPPLSDETETRRILDLLARIRFSYPDLVDEFLDTEDFPEQFQSYIRDATVEESIIQIVFSRFISFAVDTLQTESFRELFTSVLDRAVDCSKLGEWLNFLTRSLTNIAYGARLFPENE